MPAKLPFKCGQCGTRVPAGERCACQPALVRTGAHKRGYGARWTKLRNWWISIQPRCVGWPNANGCPLNATGSIVDHIIPHRGDESLLYSAQNLQTLCRSCHARKTATEGEGYDPGIH
jgi:5-methylcytosine-specific restriction endonuclease McrA